MRIIILRTILIAFQIVSFSDIFSQELCNNGFDDDNDGYIDCFDSDCSSSIHCSKFYFGKPSPDCSYIPGNDPLVMVEEWTGGPVSGHSVIALGDLDGDDIPEIIARNQALIGATEQGEGGPNAIYLFDGSNGKVKYHPQTLHVGFTNNAFLLADADKDGNGEFYYITALNTPLNDDRRIVCYEYSPILKDFELRWKSSDKVSSGSNGVFYNVDIADFNQDGTPEIYSGNLIFNSLNGNLIATGNSNAIGWSNVPSQYHPSAFTIAADVLDNNSIIPSTMLPCGGDCDGLELIAGNTVYSVNVTSAKVEAKTVADNNLPDGSTSIVDYDLDGDLDAIVTYINGNKSYMYVWDLQSSSIIGDEVLLGTAAYIGRANIGDFDSDGRPEIGICVTNKYFVIDDYQDAVSNSGNYSFLWSKGVNDASGMTSATVFDFNGDGLAEIIYRDDVRLRVFNGVNGSEVTSVVCSSPTASEHPLIADIDNDGETEIVCCCGGTVNGEIKAYKSGAKPWVPSRTVWNQHGYFSLNINDDLTVPQYQQRHYIEFPLGSGKRPFNSFMAQSTFYDSLGNISFEASDATIEILGTSCLGDSVIIKYQVCNIGNVALSAKVPFQIYDRNPTFFNSNKISNGILSSVIDAKACTVDSVKLKKGLTQWLYFVTNDAGIVSTPYNIAVAFPMTAYSECNFYNNMDSVLMDGITSFSVDTSICEGDKIKTSFLNIAGTPIIKWHPTEGVEDSFSWNTTLEPLSSVSYLLSLRDSGDVCEKQYGINITLVKNDSFFFDTSICIGEQLSTTFLKLSNPLVIKWITSDEIQDTNQWNTILTPSKSRSYILKVSSGVCEEIYIINVNVYQKFGFPIILDTTICEGDTFILNAVPGYNYNIPLSYNVIKFSDSSYGFANQSDTSIILTIKGAVCSISDTFQISVTQKPNAVIYSDKPPIICDSDTIVLSISGGLSYEWRPTDFLSNPNGKITKVFPTSTIKYEVIVDSLGCFRHDSIVISVLQSTLPVEIPSIIYMCDEREFLRAVVDSGFSIQWRDKDGKIVQEPTANGLYSLSVSNECVVVRDTIDVIIPKSESCHLFVPNAFSPNKLGLNELFPFGDYPNFEEIVISCFFSNYRLLIFNRWGEMVFISNNPTEMWDGDFKNLPAESGVYGWQLTYTSDDPCTGRRIKNNLSGNVTLLR